MVRIRTAFLASTLCLGLTQACIEVPASGSGWGDGGYGSYQTEQPILQARRNDYSDDCSQLEERIRHDKRKLREIDPRAHPDATRWFENDLEEARRARDNCRSGSRDDWRDRR